jgi:SAM-dependent methyltransferase
MRCRVDDIQRILDFYERLEARSPRDFYGHRDLAHLVRVQERHRVTLRLLHGAGLTDLSRLKILDIGCDTGDLLIQFIQWGALPEHLAGIDLRGQPIARAHQRNPRMDVRCGNAAELPWPSGHFDLVCQHTMFTSVLDQALRRRVAAEMDRVLRDGGAVLWYDFRYNNPRNHDVRGIGEREIRKLFQTFDVDLRRITLAPFIARRLPVLGLPVWYSLLASLPLLRTHYLGLFVKCPRAAGELGQIP